MRLYPTLTAGIPRASAMPRWRLAPPVPLSPEFRGTGGAHGARASALGPRQIMWATARQSKDSFYFCWRPADCATFDDGQRPTKREVLKVQAPFRRLSVIVIHECYTLREVVSK